MRSGFWSRPVGAWNSVKVCIEERFRREKETCQPGFSLIKLVRKIQLSEIMDSENRSCHVNPHLDHLKTINLTSPASENLSSKISGMFP